MDKQFINPDTLASFPRMFTQVVKTRGTDVTTIHVSGQVAIDEKGQLVGKGDLAAQAERVYANLRLALEAAGADVVLTRRPEPLDEAEKVVLPGVGAFGDCMAGLRRGDIVEALSRAVERGVPLLGICVGLQVLFEEGEEMGRHAGLGLLPARVVRFDQTILDLGYKVPHTGWNQIEPVTENPLFEGLPEGSWAYFNHAYYGRARDADVLAVTNYGGPFPSVVGRDNVYGIQFHPEKSQHVGLRILRNFVENVQ